MKETIVEKSKKISKNYMFTIGIILCTVSLIVLMGILPILGDDLLHGTVGVGIHFMEGVNGRYLGNLFGINMSSSFQLRIAIKCLALLGISYYIYKISQTKKKIFWFISFFLVLMIPKEMFRQIIVNSSGFGNYVVPVLGLLATIHLYLSQKTENNVFGCAIFLILGLINSLFVEHVTIYNFGLSVIVFIISCFKFKNKRFLALFYLIGSSLGSYLMFSNPIYLSSFAGTDDYRSITTMKDIFNKFCIIVIEAFYQNKFMTIALLYVSIKLSYLNKRRIISQILCFSSFSFLALYSLEMLNPSWSVVFPENLTYFRTGLSVLFVILLFTAISTSYISKKDKYLLSFCLISYIAILSPLLVVNPVGPRCYFPAFIFLIILVMKSLSIFNTVKEFDISKLRMGITACIAIEFVFYFTIYGTIYSESKVRLQNINSAIEDGQKEVSFYSLPYYEYLHGAEVCPEYNEKVFRMYYGIPDDIVFIKEECQ